jgi:hypothetical protein
VSNARPERAKERRYRSTVSPSDVTLDTSRLPGGPTFGGCRPVRLGPPGLLLTQARNVPIQLVGMWQRLSVTHLSGHPGRITDESADPLLCAVGEDIFVAWHRRSEESQTCWRPVDVAVITETEFRQRASRMDRGLPPLSGS